MKASPWATPTSSPMAAVCLPLPGSEGLPLGLDLAEVLEHGGLELGLVALEGGELGLDPVGDVLDVVGLVGLEEEEGRGAPGLDVVFGEEVRVPGGDDAVAGEVAGGAVVGVDAVPPPGVVGQDHVGPDVADPPGDDTSPLQGDLQLAVDPAAEADLAGRAQGPGGGPLLALAEGDEGIGVLGRVPRALRPVGEDQVVHHTPGGGPLGEGGAAVELDVVGVGGDGQGPGRDLEVGREPGHPAASRGVVGTSGGRSRSAGTSTSQVRRGGRSTRSGRPRRSASFRWAAKEPGP